MRSRHFEESRIPDEMPALLHDDWKGGVGLLVLVFVLVVVPGLALLVPGLLPGWSTPAGSLSVTLLQGNIPQDEKFQSGSGVPLALGWYGDQLNRSNTDLVVAPETAIPLLPQDLPAYGY